MYITTHNQSNCNNNNHPSGILQLPPTSQLTLLGLLQLTELDLQLNSIPNSSFDFSQHRLLQVVDMGIMDRRSLWVTVAVLMSVALVPMLAMAADEDPLQDFCVADLKSGLTINGFSCKPADKVSVSDFTFDGLKNAGNTNNPNYANVTAASVLQFPGLNTLGISAARIDFAKGGINPPHTHPRATEILLVVKGELYVGFVSTNNNTLFATTIKEGELFVFPKALVHFQLNVGKGPALAFAALSSQNPGVQQIAPALFTPDIKDEVLEKAFQIDEHTVDMIQKKFRV